MAHALGIDLGTTNVKVALVTDDGRLVAGAHRPLVTDRHGESAEQDAEATWSAVVDAVRQVTAAAPDAAAAVVAIGICSQYSSIVAVDADARPVAPMLMWQDQRGTDQCFDIMLRDENAFGLWVERHGIPTIGSGLSLGHLLHLQIERPEVHARTVAWLEPMDYLTARCTGRITASQHSTYMFQLCDNRRIGATAYDPDLVRLAGIDADRLPPLIAVDAPVGPLLPAVAAELGLPASAVVYAGTNDTATAAVATGASTPGRAGLAIGTTSVLVDGVDDFRVDLEHQLFSMPGPTSDGYVVCAENGLGGKVLEHVLEHVVYAADELGDHRQDDPFAALEEVLAATDPTDDDVLFLPWLSGALAPGGSDAIRGGFVHMSLATTRRHMVRAVVEGIAHNLGWLLPHVERFTGTPITEIAFTGGAARSDAWCTVLADILDRPVLALPDSSGAIARATARLALVRHGVVEAQTTADPGGTGGSGVRRYDPRPERRERYAARQAQFEAAYAALLPISEALR
ncbi:MAG: FGGY-family carbohydrate kinase [Actinomycetota bacterium]